MEKEKCILMGMEDSEACERSVRYVGNVLCSNQKYRIILFHVIPPLPPELLEFGGSENPQDEKILDEDQKSRQASWIRKKREAAAKFIEKASLILNNEGISPDLITFLISDPFEESDVVKGLLDTAEKNKCGTIVVGRKFYHPHYWTRFKLDISEELVRRGSGYAVWVVE